MGSSTQARGSVRRVAGATRLGFARLAVAVGADGLLPSEFRLFVSGWNDTENGRFLFDEAAAASVMAAYAEWGVDLMIDLEHQALEPLSSPDPTARDARGWCKLELRGDGSLWAVGVTWTPDGAARLSEKRQRYVSPAFEVESETSRVTKIINVAITSIPATHDTPALVAASARRSRLALLSGASGMNAELVKKALDAIAAGDSDAAMAILQDMIAGAAAPEAAPESSPEGASAPPEAMAVEPGAGDDEEDDDEELGVDKKTMAAAAREAIALTGKTNLGEAMAELARRSKLAVEQDKREQKLAADRAKLEINERRELVAQLVKLGAETPATAWSADDAKKPCKRLAAEPIDDLRERVKLLSAGRRGLADKVTPPVRSTTGGSAPVDVSELSETTLSRCRAKGVDPAKVATTLNRMLGKA